MKQRFVRILAALGLTAALLIPLAASAAVISADNHSAHVTADQTIGDDLYIYGNDVVIDGTVNGDVYAAGANITIKGTVNGDVFAAGQDVFVAGKISGSLRTAGQTVRYSGATIGGGASDFSQNFTVEKDTLLGGGLNFAAATATIRADVSRSLMGAGSVITLSGNLAKNATVAGSKLVLDGTKVAGSLNYYGNQLDKAKNPSVGGELNQHRHVSQETGNNRYHGRILFLVWSLLSMFVLAAVILTLFPGYSAGAASSILLRPLPTFGWGALAFVATLPLVILLSLTIIGIPLAILTGLIFGAAAYLAPVFVGLAVGLQATKWLGWIPNPYADAFIGITIISLLELIPVLGAFIALIVLLFGLGALVSHGRNTYLTRKA